jgi:hypothetical protein
MAKGACADAGVPSIAHVAPLHVATWIETPTRELAAPSVKQRLAALRHLFDWLVTGQVVPANPAASVHGPQHIVKGGKTPVLDPTEARALLDSIDTTTPAGLREGSALSCVVARHRGRIEASRPNAPPASVPARRRGTSRDAGTSPASGGSRWSASPPCGGTASPGLKVAGGRHHASRLALSG